ncbi:survival motor neuron protein 1-like [Pollicipes pollicipes]|uniref:survival motor neuron protein 1-like n=1 Tax=Pollicipes pollicipes TaxID=41117 RepID=UPI001884F3B8|nr:survival motor neuron protein 1-like [Pollicipes pollicipes]
MSDERTLFCRGDEDPAEHDDIWDDTALIQAYDRALASHCVALYTVDGLPYEAELLSVDGKSCELQFVGYGNRQRASLANMLMAWYVSGYYTGYYQARRERQAAAKR